MPKFKSILPLTPQVTTLIYMEDQLIKTDTSGYKEDIRILPFKYMLNTDFICTETGTIKNY